LIRAKPVVTTKSVGGNGPPASMSAWGGRAVNRFIIPLSSRNFFSSMTVVADDVIVTAVSSLAAITCQDPAPLPK